MSRPSRNTDKLLLKAGRKLLPETGICGLSQRRVSAEAGVNPGMFYFNFKTKQKFAQLVLQDIYEEFFKNFTVEVCGENVSPQERLRRALVALARFVRDNRKLFVMMIHDVIEGDAEAIRFSGDNLPRHLQVIAGLIHECQKRGVLKEMPLPCAMSFLAGSVIMPIIALGLTEKASARKAFAVTLKQAEPLLASDAMIEARAELALKALS
ncbi:MAG: TetR/AcrR family transcriptional regulator [Elusimicrobia bacterium]|nr:TetR/AcrR family transcriptional regulator [Elusimicrobiota bacterium]